MFCIYGFIRKNVTIFPEHVDYWQWMTSLLYKIHIGKFELSIASVSNEHHGFMLVL